MSQGAQGGLPARRGHGSGQADPRRRLLHPGGAPAFGGVRRLARQYVRAVAGRQEHARPALGAAAVEPLRPLVRSSSPETRAAAVRALLDLGDDEWLASELLEGDAPG